MAARGTAADEDTGPACARYLVRVGAWVGSSGFAVAGWLVVAAFVCLVGRFWHPYYGMTRLIQMDQGWADRAIHEVRDNPVFVYRQPGAYDGISYVQLAYHPLLDSSELDQALDSPVLRSRRILASAAGWILAGGRESRVADAYAMVNIIAWMLLAAILWRMLPVNDWRSWLAWVGVMLSAGAMFSVRMALTDLPAALLTVAAMGLVERGRRTPGVAFLAAAALTRETTLLSVFGAWTADWNHGRAWLRNGLIAVAAAVPLAAWLAYVFHRFGAAAPGLGDFAMPLVGWIGNWPAVVADYRLSGFRWLVSTTLLATLAVTVQAAFFVVHRRVSDGWWRIGAAFAVLLLVLGRPVWEGHPGAFTRVLLPMTIAFAFCAVRWRVSTVWLLAGSLSVFGGIEPFRNVSIHPDDLASGRVARSGYVVELADGWYPRAPERWSALAWSPGRGVVRIKFTGAPSIETLQVQLRVRGADARTLVIADAQGDVWSGELDTQWQRVDFLVRPGVDGQWGFTCTSPEPAAQTGEPPGSMPLAFAIAEVELQQAGASPPASAHR